MVNTLKFSDQLKLFLEQAKTNSLKTKQFIKEYNGTKVKVSFGQGMAARVPWISFLNEPFTTSNGIYPVYLFYKDIDKLILAYGVSETHPPSKSWNIPEPKTISAFFAENNFGKPDRYGFSFIYKVYDVNELPSTKTIDKDLNSLIGFYLNIKVDKMVETTENDKFNKNEFINSLNNSGLIFNPKLISRFISSLLTKPFVILSGLSGSGKTKLAQAFVYWICADENQYKIVPVGADWTNREPLLGYPNALEQNQYIKPDNGVVDLIIHAQDYPKLPHFLILDEMNLSHVERYFADFLSTMESGGNISFHSGITKKNNVPSTMVIPNNLFIIGTINVDETTYMFSPKVLDRANVIEFRISNTEMETFLKNPLKPNLKELTGKGSGVAESFMELFRKLEFSTISVNSINEKLIVFFNELKKTGAEFGYRSAYEIHRLINQLTVIDSALTENEKLDIAIMQKLLPKLHGSRRKLYPMLLTLGEFCVEPEKYKDIEKEIYSFDNFDYLQIAVKFPLSLEKLSRMFNGAVDNGFASYAEA